MRDGRKRDKVGKEGRANIANEGEKGKGDRL
jgi:hypothetical protein